MSYDLVLFRPKDGEDPIITAHHENDEYESENLAIDPEKEALKLKVAEALIKENPLLKRYLLDFEETAKIKNTSIDEENLQFRNVELNPPDDGNGIQIELFDDEFVITVPYWHDGNKAKSTFQEIWKYLEIIQYVSGFLVYDPQLDTILDLSKGYQESLSVYMGTRQTVNKQFPKARLDNPVRPIKKWWQFWK